MRNNTKQIAYHKYYAQFAYKNKVRKKYNFFHELYSNPFGCPNWIQITICKPLALPPASKIDRIIFTQNNIGTLIVIIFKDGLQGNCILLGYLP